MCSGKPVIATLRGRAFPARPRCSTNGTPVKVPAKSESTHDRGRI